MKQVYPSEDTLVDLRNPTTNYGDETTIAVVNVSEVPTKYVAYSMMQFDLSDIDISEDVTLNLYIRMGFLDVSATFEIAQLIKDWDEFEPTWDTFSNYVKAAGNYIHRLYSPGDISSNMWLTITITPGELQNLLQDDVLSIYLAWAGAGPYGALHFRSKESEQKRPYIEGIEAPPPTCNQQFYLEDIDTGNYITGATVEVGGVPCTEYPSIERYQKDDLVEGSWYNVVASKSGYTCPSDICKDTFEACGSAITLKLKAPLYLTIIPSSQSVPAAGGAGTTITVESNVSWTATEDVTWLHIQSGDESGTGNGFVAFTVDENTGTAERVGTITIAGGGLSETSTITQSWLGPVQCSDYTDALTCVANNCYWWSDGTCHDTEEPTKGIIEYISCTATKEAEEDYEITAVVTVKNTDTVNHKYRIKMYDSEGTHLDDEPDELDPKPEVAPGGTIDIALTTIGSIPNAKTPEILCELYDIKIGADEFIVSETKQCSEVNIGEITNISCFYNKQGETEYEIEAIVEFKNPDTISHLYKVELLDGVTKESKDWNPGTLSAGKEVAAGASSAISVSTTGIGYCASPLILIKLWETTGVLAVSDEQEYDCTDEEEGESVWKIIADFLNMSEAQVKAIAMAGGGLLALSFILPLLRR
ncbi:BACON domain-containing protein [candidate division WOR-3 bacterium]|nr:BACON domain-containing protein [candidate division WOR-3 bacterium]